MTANPVARRRAIGPVRFFALSFGCVVGSGWVVVLGDWLKACGPAGVVLGMLAGGSVMLANSGAYAELIARYPVAGGEFVFAQRLFGNRTAFLIGWLYTLSLIAVAVFEATALPWLLETLIPALKGPALYISFGRPVTADALAVDLVGTVLIATVNYRGGASAASLQSVLSFVFLALALLIISLSFALGSAGNLEPLVAGEAGRPWWLGALWIFAIAPMFLNGFQSVAQTVEERAENVTYPRIARSMGWALMVGIIFYCLITLAAASARPWQSLLGRPLATAAAVEALLPHRLLAIAVLSAAVLSVVRLWNGVTLWATRLLMAQSRAGFLPAWMSATNARHGSPTLAVLFVALCTAAGSLLGAGAIIPVVDMASLCLAGILVFACIAALRARAAHPTAMPYATVGGAATLIYALCGSAAMCAFMIADPLLRRPGRIPLEWIVTAAWLGLGLLYWSIRRPGKLTAPA